MFLHTASDLDEGEGRSGAERLRFMLHLVLDVLLHALVLVDVLLLLHVEQDPGRHGDGDGVLRLRLRELAREAKNDAFLISLCASQQPHSNKMS